MDKQAELDALRKRYTAELDVAISAVEAETWETAYVMGAAAMRNQVARVLEAQGVSSDVIDALPPAPVASPLTVSEYVTHALRTENIDFAGIRERLTARGMFHVFRLLLLAQVQTGAMMEAVKKHIFYGKPLPRWTREQNVWLSAAHDVLQRVLGPEHWHQPQGLDDDRTLRVLHALAGLVSEAGELVEPVFDYVCKGVSLDVSNLAEEAGDNQWYIAVLSDALRELGGQDLETLMQANVAKLKARYAGKGFTPEKALNRDKDAEDEAREGAG